MVFVMVAKILYFMRVSSNLAKIVKLTTRVFYDVAAFSLFLGFWMVVFVKLYIIAGVNLFDAESQEETYNSLPTFVALMIQCFRNSLGDIESPTYSYWVAED